MKRISAPIESLMIDAVAGRPLLETDYLIVGSGYGGAVAAMRLASGGPDGNLEPRRDVVVLERGKEYLLGDFPYDIEDLPSHIHLAREGQTPSGYSDALFHLHTGSEAIQPDQGEKNLNGRSVADVLVGSGLGGTSLINANVAEEPKAHVFRKPAWPKEFHNNENLLTDAFTAVREKLGVTQRIGYDDGQPFPKYTALQRFAASIAKTSDDLAQPAWITVNTSEEGNKLGVLQAPCTDCGNCVTGCNVGAKNSLDRNLLRLAKSRGARFYTGATVTTIQPIIGGTHRWKVIVQPTVQPVGMVDPEKYVINAKSYVIFANYVILAAGSLGSTEILLRSKDAVNLDVSAELGKKFSTNGDGLIMSYAQTEEVGAIAEAPQKQPLKRVGPTITGIIRTRGVSIEDASVPAPLARILSELVTTSAMLQRMVDRKLPPLIDQQGHDPLAASMEVADHCQVFLVQSDDGADGELSLGKYIGAPKIAFPHSSIVDNKGLVDANKLVQSQDRDDGLDGGQYAPNPLWQLVPKEASGVLGGKLPAGRALTVHPLGGCAMADDESGGVVNHAGQVFKSNGDLHEGLYVMDGAIIPVALEVNPFLTIAALAWRNTGFILNGAAAPESKIEQVSDDLAELGSVPERQRNRPHPTDFCIQEQLTGAITDLPPWFKNHLSDTDQRRLLERHGLVVMVNAGSDRAEAWLDNPGKAPLGAAMELYINPVPAEMVGHFRPVGVTQAHLALIKPFMTLQGTFTILPEKRFKRERRAGISAIKTYIKRRGWSDVNLTGDEKASLWKKVKNMLKGARIFHNLGVLQSRFRHLTYDFHDEVSGIHIRGEKVLGYSQTLERMWPALVNLTLDIKEPKARRPSRADLTVNIEYLLEPGLLQIQKSANLPQSLLFAGGLAAFFVRSLFATNFWEFAALQYPETPLDRPFPPPLKVGDHTILPDRKPLYVPLRVTEPPDGEKIIKLWLTHYSQPGGKPLLLLHGLAQGSQIFWTGQEQSLATYFLAQGYDVWLLDYRLSNLVLPELFRDQEFAAPEDRDWCMDEIARFDIPMAIDAVCEKTKSDKIRVLAHCVGACTLAMAALHRPGLGDKIEAAIGNAIHPWVIASAANRFRTKFGNFYREWVPERLLDALPTKETAGALQNVIDRLAYGLARINEQEADKHMDFDDDAVARGICDRMTFLYGRMWNHENLTPETHTAFAKMLGPAPAGVYQHMYYYNRLRRITDREGENSYLQRHLIKANWTFPMLFVHGGDSRVFNPHSARRSALRLRNILDSTNKALASKMHYRIFENYGHMDVIFGKNAHRKCFPEYLAFFNDPASFKSTPAFYDLGDAYEAKPDVGPLLRAVWKEDNTLCLRFWSELKTNVTTLPVRLIADGGGVNGDYEIVAPNAAPPSHARFRLLDVRIEDTKSPIELSVRGEIPQRTGDVGEELVYDEQAWLRRLRAMDHSGYQKHMNFLVGSCRFPGSIVDNALSDSVFRVMHEHTASATGAQLLFLIGDQIYADATDQLFEVNSLHAKYSDRYRRAFKAEHSPNFAKLVTQIPTHFALDDHEIDDNWSGLPANASQVRKQESEFAIDTAARFMSSGRNYRPVLNRPLSGHFWYALSHPQECDFPAFVADTRTERAFRDSDEPCPPSLDLGRDRDLMSPEQYAALKGWLLAAHRSNAYSPKFIFSGSIIAPLSKRYCEHKSTWRLQDGWAGYPKTLEDLLTFITRESIRNVIFVGGDAHLSSTSRIDLKLASGKEAVVWQIVSSGLYAPMPFANSHVEDYEWFMKHSLPTHNVSNTGQPVLSVICENTPLSDHYHQFMRVDANKSGIIVTCMNEFNQEVARKHIAL